MATADLDDDGFIDAVVGAEDGDLTVLMNNGDGTFARQSRTSVAERLMSIALGDVDGDGRPDIVLVDGDRREVKVLLNPGCRH